MKLRDFRALTFDCYGTLIDWESGLMAALQPLMRLAGREGARDAVLAEFAAHEAAHVAFGRSIPDWPAFPDSAAALAYLKRHYLLVILSNVDRASFAGSNARLGVAFDAICTAQDIGSYKPDPRNFRYLLGTLERLGVEPRQILHTAQSLYHDHAPAQAAGLASAWIDRRQDAQGWGATRPPAGTPVYNFRFTSLAELASAHQAETAAL